MSDEEMLESAVPIFPFLLALTEMVKRLETDLKKRGMEEFDVKRYRSLDDLCDHNMMVAEGML